MKIIIELEIEKNNANLRAHVVILMRAVARITFLLDAVVVVPLILRTFVCKFIP